MKPQRDEALQLLTAYTESDSLIKHCLAVESAMRFYAEKNGLAAEEVEKWGVAGLLHDFDYEKHPDEHPLYGMKVLQEQDADPELIKAIASHYEAKTGVAPETPMERHLFACDELSGFIIAVTYVRPSKSVHDVKVKSVTKKLKTPAFAAGVNREDVEKGAQLIGLELNDHIANVIEALQRDAEALGLSGNQD
ncbi:MAG: HD domain-containing protein [Fimbriimonadaceae bacterium]